MRRKLAENEKRSNIIGVKVKPETRQKLEWIAKREATRLSSYIDELLRNHIETYFKYNHIEWDKLPEDEKASLLREQQGGL